MRTEPHRLECYEDASSWACRILKRLRREGLVTVPKRGRYRLNGEGHRALTNYLVPY